MNAHANAQSNYQGLPAVPCIDPTKSIVQNYSVTLHITKDFQEYPLPEDIGHDPGNCLRVIHTNAANQTIFVTANDMQPYTIDDCFKVWHKNMVSIFSKTHMHVYVEAKEVNTGEKTLLRPNEHITVVYASL